MGIMGRFGDRGTGEKRRHGGDRGLRYGEGVRCLASGDRERIGRRQRVGDRSR